MLPVWLKDKAWTTGDLLEAVLEAVLDAYEGQLTLMIPWMHVIMSMA